MNSSEIYKILYSVCVNGNLLQLQNVNLTHEHVRNDYYLALRRACRFGQLEVLKWLDGKFGLTVIDAKCLSNWPFSLACSFGHLEIAKWIVNVF